MEVKRKALHGIHPSPIFYLVLAITGLSAYLCVNQNIGPLTIKPSIAVFLFVTSGWILSLIFHEFGHAYVAWRGGDLSVAAKGYLTLNPLKYAHPVLSIAMPVVILLIGGIGLPGGAVWIDHSKLSPERESGVSAAGPFASFLFGVICLAPLLLTSIPKELNLTTVFDKYIILAGGLAFLGGIQIISVVINLLPVPGLDGYGILEPTLSPEIQRSLAPLRNMGIFILFFLIFSTDVGQWLWIPVEELFKALGIDYGLFADGYRCYRFWNDDILSSCNINEFRQSS